MGGAKAIQRKLKSDKQTKTDKISRDRSSVGQKPGVGAKILQ